jgi:putative colanic acid biosynthesis UDP-glucose lipid carrier transferase
MSYWTCQLWDKTASLEAQNKTYSTKIKRYMKRHYVKPGITETCRLVVSGGEIKRDQDMINKLSSMFYIESGLLYWI